MAGINSRVSGRRSFYLLTGILAAAVIPAARAAAQTAVNSNDVYLSQVEYSDDAGTDISPNGQLLVNTGDSALTGGYINVADKNGNWIVQNMPVVAGMPAEAAVFPLGTADGTNDTGTSMNLSVDVSPAPLVSFAPTTPTAVAVAGEDVEDDEGKGAAGNPTPVQASNLSFSINGQNRIAIDLGVPNVQAANNQCAPAAIANALTWLKNNKGLNIPDANVPGRGALAGTPVNPSAPLIVYAANTLVVPNGGANTSNYNAGTMTSTYQSSETAGNSLVGKLDLTMLRTSSNRARFFNAAGVNQNKGVNATPEVTGTEQYLGNVGDAAVVKIDTQGDYPVVTTAGITNNNLNGATPGVTANFLYNELSTGEAVAVGYTGHETELIATGSILGQPWVFLQSDLAQTPQNDSLDAKLNLLANLPAGYTNATSIPEFSYLNEAAQTFPGLGVNVLDSLAISVVPEPSAIALACGSAALLLARPRRRAAV